MLSFRRIARALESTGLNEVEGFEEVRVTRLKR